jgi:hypothetical protein
MQDHLFFSVQDITQDNTGPKNIHYLMSNNISFVVVKKATKGLTVFTSEIDYVQTVFCIPQCKAFLVKRGCFRGNSEMSLINAERYV